MIALLDTFGPAVWRASWQAAVLGLAVVAVSRLLGERIAPRWRYLLWCIVAVRLLWVTTPASPWSAFNLVRWGREATETRIARNQADPKETPGARSGGRDLRPAEGRSRIEGDSTPDGGRLEGSPTRAPKGAANPPPVPADLAPESGPSAASPPRVPAPARILSAVCLAGSLLFGVRLLGAVLVLRRRLAICRPVTDAAVLTALGWACRRAGLGRPPGLLVTPASTSPCIVGTRNPRIVVPESILADASDVRIRHVLAHELAHIVRGDLWTNWLLLAARVLHWFNPLAWWLAREMQAEREAACDELAVAALGESDRSAYAATIVDLAANLAPSGMAPAMIGLISSTRRLRARIERLQRRRPVASLRTPVAAGIVAGMALVGLTDAMPASATAQAPASPEPAQEKAPRTEAGTVTLRGRCVDHVGRTSMAGASVRLFRARGRTSPIVEVARTDSDPEGRFEFPGLTPPRHGDPLDPLIYLVFAEAADRPIGVGGIWMGPQAGEDSVEIRFLREKTMLAGTVVDTRGVPVPGATVAQWDIDGRPVPGLLSATTGPDGRFLITRIPHHEWLRGGGRPQRSSMTFTVSHPRYPEASLEVRELPRNVTVTLSDGCRVTGTVTDGVTGRPAAGALVVAERLGRHAEAAASTDDAGRFEMVLAEDRYNFSVRARDRVALAITDRECLAGEALGLPPFTLIRGGFIAGRVVNASTGQAIAVGNGGGPVALGLIGPSQPLGKVISPSRVATVDRDGQYTIRAAPGENFPYLVNLTGDRMGWNTTRQSAVLVREGETTTYDMLVTPRRTPAEKREQARKVIDSLPIPPPERTARVLVEFRKLDHTVDETELWCSLMRELVAIGRDATPQLCAELDRTTGDRTLRRLGFAARAIGDTRAVPALIRAIPRTLLPASSDYGLIVEDGQLAEFMQEHDLRDGPVRGRYFDFGRAVREVTGALRGLTGQGFDDAEIFGVDRSEDPRRRWHQRQLFMRQARRWQTWWEAHWREFTEDAAYQRVDLKVDDVAPPPVTTRLGPGARLGEGVIGAVLSPANEGGGHAEYFYDLDTGASPGWPAHIPRDEARSDPKQLADWAADRGVDLMCVTHRAADGTETFVLRSFGMRAWEISPRDLRNLDKLIAAGTPPKGHDVGELLMHHDEGSKRSVPDANAAFLYVTREGSMGLIETTDRVTRKADLTGGLGDPPAGVGFHTGVRFNLKSIIP
jgi:beta-lactamase regulating signal transducer with metallopeptidase domain